MHANQIDDYEGAKEFLEGARKVENKDSLKAVETIERLLLPNYWSPSEKNAKRSLHGLLAFAQLRPDGVWDGD